MNSFWVVGVLLLASQGDGFMRAGIEAIAQIALIKLAPAGGNKSLHMDGEALGLVLSVEQLCPKEALAVVGDDYYFKVFQDTCYMFITYDKVVYESALRKCQQHGGTLAMPKTKAINDFLLRQMVDMSQTKPMWIGMHDKAAEGTMVWEDGSDVEWDNFDWFTHGLFGGSEDCVTLNPDDEEWHDHPCSEPWISGITSGHKNAFICQYKI